jgi:hypothetical protein
LLNTIIVADVRAPATEASARDVESHRTGIPHRHDAGIRKPMLDGLINGDFFKSIVAFSPGFVISGESYGKPRIFISHGTKDHILPIDRCGRRIATELKGQGYDVTFREFDGDHEVPEDIAREGLSWVT